MSRTFHGVMDTFSFTPTPISFSARMFSVTFVNAGRPHSAS